MSYAQHKQRVVEIVDATYRATLAGLPAARYPRRPAISCDIGESGDDYAPSGAIEVMLGEDADLEAISERVRRYWEREGFEIISVGKDLTITARDDDYSMSIDVYPNSDKAVIGATGPCATPASEAERDARPKFKSATAKDERGTG